MSSLSSLNSSFFEVFDGTVFLSSLRVADVDSSCSFEDFGFASATSLLVPFLRLEPTDRLLRQSLF